MPLEVIDLKCGYSYPYVEVNYLKFKEGNLYGLIGPNGSGKSTFIKAILGLVKVFSGSILFDKKDVLSLDDTTRARLISLMVQNINVNFPFSVYDIVMMGRYPHEKSRFINDVKSKLIVEENIKKVELEEKKYNNILKISGGERQRAFLAKLLCQEARILLLDEPNSSLDINHQERIFQILKTEAQRGNIVICAVHNIKLAAKHCDNVVLFNEGRIVDFGRPEDVINDENIEKAYNVNAIVYKNPFGIFDIEIIQRQEIAKKHVHVVCGGGVAQKVFKVLVEKGYEVSTGVLETNDSDFELAQLYKIYTVFARPFSPISEDEYIKNIEMIKRADFCVLCNIPFGIRNIKNLEALRFAKKLFIIENTPIEERDFTNGYATYCYNLLKRNATIVDDIEKIF